MAAQFGYQSKGITTNGPLGQLGVSAALVDLPPGKRCVGMVSVQGCGDGQQRHPVPSIVDAEPQQVDAIRGPASGTVRH